MNLKTNSDIENDFYKVCNVNELKENSGKKFFINDTEIALFKVNGITYALSNICPHQHSSTIYEGFIEEECVVCPNHGWKFNLKDGKKSNNLKGLDSYEIKIINDYIYVKVTTKKFNW